METLELMPTRIRITSILKKAIFSGEIKSGDELSLTDVAGKLGVSRTPVREAFQTLASEGLITLRMNKGAIVNRIDEKFIKDIFEMRALMESEAAAKAAINGMETDGLLKRLYELQKNLPSVDTATYEALNSDVHMSIWKAADNAKLQNYLMELWNGPSTGHSIPETKVHYEKSTEEHILILNYIKDGNVEGARAEMRHHIMRSQENVLRALVS
ncbi:MAG: GntR family transcriptional regulator [Oribacterium sp.]|nr:GntR family transcriptional regulator [Oribacterium sp.]